MSLKNFLLKKFLIIHYYYCCLKKYFYKYIKNIVNIKYINNDIIKNITWRYYLNLEIKKYETGLYYIKSYYYDQIDTVIVKAENFDKDLLVKTNDKYLKRKQIYILYNHEIVDINLEILDNYYRNYLQKKHLISNLADILNIMNINCTHIKIITLIPYEIVIKEPQLLFISDLYYENNA